MTAAMTDGPDIYLVHEFADAWWMSNLPLGIYERTILIRATYELVQKQAMPRP